MSNLKKNDIFQIKGPIKIQLFTYRVKKIILEIFQNQKKFILNQYKLKMFYINLSSN